MFVTYDDDDGCMPYNAVLWLIKSNAEDFNPDWQTSPSDCVWIIPGTHPDDPAR